MATGPDISSCLLCSSDHRRACALDALDVVGTEDSAHRQATRLSGGQQQRVAFARALMRRPKLLLLLLLDEPLSNPDAKLREQMRFEMQELISRAGVTTLCVTHDQFEARAMSDTVAVISGGRIVQAGGRMVDWTHYDE